MRRPKRLLFAIPLTLALALTACSAESDSPSSESSEGGEAAATEGGTFSVSSSEPEAFAPTSNCYSSDCSQIINAVFTGLLKVDPETSEPVYTGAESFESEDGQNWTITLKDGFTFHNGEPVDAESYVRAWNYAANAANATQLGFFFSKVEGYDDLQGENPKSEEMSGLTVVDDLTFEVALTEPFSQFPLTMSYTPAAAPMAQECMDDIKACNEQPIGNGPYQFAEAWNHNQSITLEKYADYSDEETAGLADGMEFKIYADLSTAFRDFQGGSLDIVQPDPSQIPQARAQYADNLLEVDSGSFAYFGFPFYEPDFAKPEIRQALSLAIDRQSIIDNVLAGRFIPATDVISPFVPGSPRRRLRLLPVRPRAGQDPLGRGRRCRGQQDLDLVQQRRWPRAVGQGHGSGLEARPRCRLRVQVAAVHAVPQGPGHPVRGRRSLPSRLAAGLPVPAELPRPAVRRGFVQLRQVGRRRLGR